MFHVYNCLFCYPGTGSLTVLKRSQGSAGKTRTVSRSSLERSISGDSLASLDITQTDNLPAIDTPEASHVCSKRWVPRQTDRQTDR